MIAKVLELDEGVLAITPHHSLHELINEVIVFASHHTLLSQTHIQRILQQINVIGAHIHHNGQTLMWLDASQRRVQRQLAHRDTHAAGTQVTQAQDTLAVCHTNCTHIRLGPVLHYVEDVTTIIEGHKETMRTSVDQTKTLAGQTHCGCVHNGHQILNVLGEEAEEETLVAVVQITQIQILVQWLCIAIHCNLAQLQLFLLRLETRRLQAVYAQHLSLLQGKG